MARIRQAVRCHARRKNGQPCRAYAMLGQRVCRMHGGSSPQALHSAFARRVEANLRREFNVEYDGWMRARRAWMAWRVMTASALTGIPPGKITYSDVVWAEIDHSISIPAPKMRRDRRYGPRWLQDGQRRR